MAKEKKSEAELYREERKKRIANASKRKGGSSKVGSTIAKVVLIALGVACIAAVVVYYCYSFGVQENFKIALRIGDTKITAAEFSYIYDNQYSNLVSQADQFDEQNSSYGVTYAQYYGFDQTKSPAEQKSTETDDDGNYLTWAEVLSDRTSTYFRDLLLSYNEALKEGYELTEEDEETIDANIESMESTAHQNNISLNSYLRLSYGKGITEGVIRRQMEREAIAQRFVEEKEASFGEKYTVEELTAEYEKDKDSYDVVDLRINSFAPETLTQGEDESDAVFKARQDKENADAKKNAEAMFAAVKDEKSFISLAEKYHEQEDAEAETTDAEQATEHEHDFDSTTKAFGTKKSSLDGYSLVDESLIPEKYKKAAEDAKEGEETETYTAGTWAFEDGRKAGDKVLVSSDNNGTVTYLVMYMVKTQYPQDVVDVRHILFSNTETDDSGNSTALDEAAGAEKKKKAEEVLAEWNALSDKEKTEEKFGELADKYSEDPGSNGSSSTGSCGGLYENVTPGRMVSEFDEWIFSDKRKVGDVELIESDYGYHIMYYVGNREYEYLDTLRTNHKTDDYSSWVEEKQGEDEYQINENEKYINAAVERSIEFIETNLEAKASQSSYSY